MSNFIKQDFTKNDLQLGQILETREGELYVNAGVQWLSKNDWLRPDGYNNNLIENNSEELDIIRVYELNPASIRGFNFDTPDTQYLKLIWERDEIKYEKIDFITALEMMKDDKGVFVSYYGKSIDDYNEIVMKIELKSIEVIKFKECSAEISEGEHFKLTSIEDKPSVYTEKISNMVNNQFYRKVI